MDRLTEAVNVLSWDCGLSNIAYCLVEYVNNEKTEFKVRMWENFSLNELEVIQAVESLVRELDKRPWMVQADHVCIESQLFTNTTMKIISHALQTYFVTKSKRHSARLSATSSILNTCGPRVHFVVPQNKFKVCSVPEPKGAPGHARNKRVAIAMAKKILAKEPSCIAYLDSHKKKDDLADSMLQGIYFLRQLSKKKVVNRKLQGLIGHKREIVINETADPSIASMPHVYRSENFSVPEFDYNSSSVTGTTLYSRFSKDAKM